MELGQETKDDEGGRTPSGDGDGDDAKEVVRDGGSGSDDEGTRQPYNCTFCRRGFPTAQALGGHMNVHRKDRLGRASTSAPTTVAAARGACSYEPMTTAATLVDASTGYGWDSHPASGAGGSLLIHAERAPQELRLFGRKDGAADRREEGSGARDRRRDGNDDDHGGEGEEELDLELRLGAAGQ